MSGSNHLEDPIKNVFRVPYNLFYKPRAYIFSTPPLGRAYNGDWASKRGWAYISSTSGVKNWGIEKYGNPCSKNAFYTWFNWKLQTFMSIFTINFHILQFYINI